MQRGYPLLNALQLLHKDSVAVQERLQQGMSIEELLMEGNHPRFVMHLQFFLQVGSISEAIGSALHMRGFERGIKQKLLKQCSYPAFLFVFSFVILWMFTQFIIPQMLQSFSLDHSFGLLLPLINGLQGLFVLLLLLLAAGAMVFLLSSISAQRAALLYQHGNRVPMLKDLISYQFSGYLIELVQKGISTKDAMQYLLQLNKDTVCFHVVQQIVQALENGFELQDIITACPLLNSSFQLMFRMGAYNDKLCELLLLFMRQQELIWDKTIRKAGLLVQCIAYVFIACMVLIVYQIMLVPLSMLETM